MFYNQNQNNNGGFYNPSVGPVGAMGYINYINNTINNLKHVQYRGTEVMELLRQMESQKILRIVGKGTNRAIIEFPNCEDLKSITGLNMNLIFKIPVQIGSGAIANFREALCINVLNTLSSRGDREALELLSFLPACKMIEGTDILAEEKVIPIEFSTDVLKIAGNTKRISGEVTMEDPTYEHNVNIGKICRDILVEGKGANQTKRLMDLMSKFFIIGDLNPDYSPFNFGIKNVNGRGYVTSLDNGAVLPKNGVNLLCPKCGSRLNPIFPWTEGLTSVEKNRLATGGVYTCNNKNCTTHGPSIFKDIDVLMMQRQKLQEMIYNSNGNHELLDRI